ncbi:MAG: ClbS/DfsB family four-helix bundle protein [Ardenticatenales bacterium]|nr:ClbS/DfsB family four-helix bundle protein [Ardenticatenales bacterium]
MDNISKADLLDTLRENRALFDAHLSQVSEEKMAGTDTEETWSGKDVVAHITVWEQRLVNYLACVARGEPGPLLAPEMGWEETHRLNAEDYAANHHRLPADILADSHRSFEQLLAHIERFSEEALTDPGHFSWAKGRPLWRRIMAGPGYGHYQGHLYDLLQMIEPEKHVRLDPALLDRYAGSYQGPRRGHTLTVRVAEGQLVRHNTWDGAEAAPQPCLPVDERRFVFPAASGMLIFQIEADGSVPAVEEWSYLFTRVDPV